jgi:hypothetical protein
MTMAFAERPRTKADASRGAIGEVILRFIRRGEAGPWDQLAATLQRSGDPAAKMVRSAMDEAAGKAPPPDVMYAKPVPKTRAPKRSKR